jgi:hypothetical protein
MTNFSIEVNTPTKIKLSREGREVKAEIRVTPRHNGKGFVIEVMSLTGEITLFHNLPVEGELGELSEPDNTVAELSQSVEVRLADTKADYSYVEKQQNEIVRTIFGKKFTGDWGVRECMNKLFERQLTDDEFAQFYPLYRLGFQTGRGVGLASKRQTLEFMMDCLNRRKRQEQEGGRNDEPVSRETPGKST